jgi:hypothetical protein
MLFVNILVHQDSSRRTAARVALSLRIAQRVGRGGRGCLRKRLTPIWTGRSLTWPSAQHTAAMETDHAVFIDLNRVSDDEIIHRATAIARTFDLVVLGQTRDDVPVPARVPDELITESGRPAAMSIAN